MRFIYIDNNASTQVHREVVEVMRVWTESSSSYGNPHAGHFLGDKSREAIDNARLQVLGTFGISGGWRCVFTSGATESVNFAHKGIVFNLMRRRNEKNKPIRILTSPVEHGAVDSCLRWLVELLGADSIRVEKMLVDPHGIIDVQSLRNTLTNNDFTVDLITCIHTVAETGAVQPIEEISRIVRESHPNVIFHTDASQSVGKLENELLVSLSRSCDLITVAGHKFHAPKGVGALLIKNIIGIDPLLHGAGQEYGLRGGTENVAAIVGLGKACELSKVKPSSDYLESIKSGWNKFSNRLDSAGIDFRLNSTAPQRSPFTINFSVAGLDAPALVKSIGNADGIRVCFSAGSACHSRGGPSPSKVLQAMGLDPRYSTSGIRLSFGKLNELQDVDEAFTILASYIISAIHV